METHWDCIVVGGGAAGLSAALVLGRARRRTLVVDVGRQSNQVAQGIGGLLGHDRRPPAELYAAGREQLAAYPSVELRSGEVVGGERTDRGFVLDLADAAGEAARRVLLATGMDYVGPDVAGVTELWGDTVFHCPFCHGWELRDRPLAVLARGQVAAERALLLRAWSDDVVLLTDGPADIPADAHARLAAARVGVVERRLARLRDCSAHGGCGRHLDAVVFKDGGELPREGLLVDVVLRQRSPLAEQLGAATVAGPLAPDAVEVDPMGHTSVAGLFAAGDLTGQAPSVANAIAAGSNTAAMIVHGLMTEAKTA